MALDRKTKKKADPFEDMKEKLDSLLEVFDEYYEEAKLNKEKFTEKRNKAAAGRVRKNMQAMKKTAQEIRLLVTEMKKSL